MNKFYNNDDLKYIFQKIKQDVQIKNKSGNGIILLDGLWNSSFNIFLNLAIGIAANQVKGLKPVFLTEKNTFSDIIARGLNIPTISAYQYLEASVFEKIDFYFARFRKKLIQYNDIINYSINGIDIGDLIYDEIIRYNDKIVSKHQFDKTLNESYLNKAYTHFFSFQYILKRNNVEYLALSHKFYIKFGLPARLMISKGKKFLSINRAHLNLIDNIDDIYKNDFYIDNENLSSINSLSNNTIEEYIENKFLGKLNNLDVKFAYKDKRKYSKLEIQNQLNLSMDKPVAAIMPHAFSDAPHCDSFMIYDDYYIWLIETLKITSQIRHVQWIIKPHPTSSIYFEEGIVQEIIQEYGHIKLVPQDIITSSVLDIADAVITVRGTAALEGILFDAQPILAGAAYFMDLGFTTNCKSVEEYTLALKSIKKKTSKPDEIKDLVKRIMYWRTHPLNYESGIFGKELLPNLNEEEKNKQEAENLSRIAEYLSSNDYYDDPYFQKLLKFFKEDKKYLSTV